MTGYQPSEVLQGFLDYVDQIKAEYQSAREAVGKEDKRLQDLLHELEFAEDKAARNRVATKFQRSRRERRRQKDGAAARPGCNYYVITDRERGCDVEKCDKWEEE